MFPSRTHSTARTFGRSAARTARLLKAFATLDLRPLDDLGRPVDGIRAAACPDALPARPARTRRPGTSPRIERCSRARRPDAGGTPAVVR